ncbi:MAG: STAS domain-containing protein [Deltaproteobacteria bacterium]|nr:STAS domain-containing protein [Deltaproteobacteria bacterium]
MGEITIIRLGDRILVPIQVELHDRAARKLQEEVLANLERTGASGLIIDVSAVDIVDSFLGRLLVETARMARLLAAETVLVGMKKEVVMTILQLGMPMEGVCTALNLEDALALLDRLETPAGEDTPGEEVKP